MGAQGGTTQIQDARKSLRLDSVIRVGLLALVLVLSIRLLFFVVEASTKQSHGFVAHYTAARAVAEGAEASLLYDDAWFRARVKRYTPDIGDIFNINLPTTALLMLPLAALDYTTARVAWTLFSLACFSIAGAWLVWHLGLRGIYALGYLVFVLLYQPLYANFQLGQVYAFLFGLLVLAWYGYRRSKPLLLGISLGSMLVLKTAGGLLWLLLLVQRRWQALSWGLGTALIFVLGSFPLLGLSAWSAYFQVLPTRTSNPALAVTAYQTQLSLLRHLFAFDEQWNPAPLFRAPEVGTWLPWITFTAIALLSVIWSLRTKEHDMTFAVFVLASVMLNPFSLDYHYVLLLLPIAILVERARRWPSRAAQAILVFALFLIAADLPYRSPQLSAGAWALLAYPKLYGALLLWGLALAEGRWMKPKILQDDKPPRSKELTRQLGHAEDATWTHG